MSKRVLFFRLFHGILSIYFIGCLIYLYFVGIAMRVNDALFTIVLLSVMGEGIAVYIFNGGDCPLIHVGRKIGDEKAFFELLLPPKAAKIALPFFAVLTLLAITLLLLRFVAGV
ncbi:MAG TPA: hypothetical protein VF466_05005 [Candidatus Saccharimonadales bacterium]